MSTFPSKNLHLTRSHSQWSILGFLHPLAEDMACNNPIVSACHCPLLGDARVAERRGAAEGVRRENPKGFVDFMVLL